MPKIPQASSEVGIKVGNVPQMNTPEMGMGPINRSQQAQKEVINSIENAENVIIKIRDFRQQTEAQNYAFERLNEIKSRADEDTDFNSAPYETEINKVGTEAAKTITGRLAKEDFMAGFQRQATAAKWGIKNEFRAKELKSIDASIDYQAQQIINNYGGMNDAERMTNVANYRRALENGVKVGLYNKATAEAKYAVFQNKVVEGKVEYDILSNPSYALAELQQGKEGEYAALPDNKRVDFIKQAETRIEKLKNQEEEAIAIASNQRESELIDMKIAGTLTVPFVKKERELTIANGVGISASFADTMIRALESPKTVKAKTDFNTYESIMADIVNPKITATEKKVKILDAYADGKLSDEDRDSLLFVGKMGQDPIFKKSIEEQNPGFWGKVWQIITNHYPGKDKTKDRVNTMSNIIKKAKQENLTEDKIPQIINEETRKNRLAKYPWIVNLPQEGEVRLFPDGTKKQIYPDGRIEDVK